MRTLDRLLLALALTLPAFYAAASTMRCDNGIVSQGETMFTVLDKCREPASRKKVDATKDSYGNLVQGAATIEYWVYQPPGGMNHHLRFIDGRLVDLRSQR
jgi:hypothetical protein